MNAGAGDEILLEDAEDLAEWQSRPPIVENGIVIPRPIVPQLAEWDLSVQANIADEALEYAFDHLMS